MDRGEDSANSAIEPVANQAQERALFPQLCKHVVGVREERAVDPSAQLRRHLEQLIDLGMRQKLSFVYQNTVDRTSFLLPLFLVSDWRRLLSIMFYGA